MFRYYKISIKIRLQVRLSEAIPGIYRVRVVGTDVPVGPQRFAVVITAPRLLLLSNCPPEPLECADGCSGHGKCGAGGLCECVPGFGGYRCEEVFSSLLCGDAGRQLVVSSSGWAFYILALRGAADQPWRLELRSSAGDPDYFLAFNRLPRVVDYDLALADASGDADISCDVECSAQVGHAYMINTETICSVLSREMSIFIEFIKSPRFSR